jgi:hypothetical protein
MIAGGRRTFLLSDFELSSGKNAREQFFHRDSWTTVSLRIYETITVALALFNEVSSKKNVFSEKKTCVALYATLLLTK